MNKMLWEEADERWGNGKAIEELKKVKRGGEGYLEWWEIMSSGLDMMKSRRKSFQVKMSTGHLTL